MDTAVIHIGESALRELRSGHWDRLRSDAPHPDPTRSGAWIAAWWGHGTREGEPALVVVERAGEWAAALPLELYRSGPLRRARHLGSDGPWMNLEPPARDDAARQVLLGALSDLEIDLVTLDGVETGGPTASAADRVSSPRRVTSNPGFRLEIASPPRSMRKRRKEVRRGLRRADDAGRPLSTESFRGDAAATRLDDLLDFHAIHFDRDEENGFAGPAARPFTTTVLADICRDDLRLVEVRDHEGALVAFDLAIVAGSYAISYSGGLDRDSGLPNLGWISVMAILEDLEQEGVEIVDFGPNSAGYKSLIADPVAFEQLYLPVTARARVALALHRALGGARGLFQRGAKEE